MGNKEQEYKEILIGLGVTEKDLQRLDNYETSVGIIQTVKKRQAAKADIDNQVKDFLLKKRFLQFNSGFPEKEKTEHKAIRFVVETAIDERFNKRYTVNENKNLVTPGGNIETKTVDEILNDICLIHSVRAVDKVDSTYTPKEVRKPNTSSRAEQMKETALRQSR